MRDRRAPGSPRRGFQAAAASFLRAAEADAGGGQTTATRARPRPRRDSPTRGSQGTPHGCARSPGARVGAQLPWKPRRAQAQVGGGGRTRRRAWASLAVAHGGGRARAGRRPAPPPPGSPPSLTQRRQRGGGGASGHFLGGASATDPAARGPPWPRTGAGPTAGGRGTEGARAGPGRAQPGDASAPGPHRGCQPRRQLLLGGQRRGRPLHGERRRGPRGMRGAGLPTPGPGRRPPTVLG